MTPSSFVGTWELLDYKVTLQDGCERAWCDEPYGLLIYTPNGYMSVAINCKGEGACESPSQRFGHLLLYSGKYSVKDENQIVHHILNTCQLDQLGWSVVRNFNIEGENLTLSGPPIKDLLGFRIIWKRLA